MKAKITKLSKVTALMEEGFKAKDISKALGISISNTYNYMTRVRKLRGDAKPTRKYVKRKSVYNKDGVNTGNTFNTPPKTKTKTKRKEEQVMLGRYVRELEMKLHNITNKQSQLELALAEKDKEIWTLECEVFDKKAVIKYLEEKLFAKGVSL